MRVIEPLDLDHARCLHLRSRTNAIMCYTMAFILMIITHHQGWFQLVTLPTVLVGSVYLSDMVEFAWWITMLEDFEHGDPDQD